MPPSSENIFEPLESDLYRLETFLGKETSVLPRSNVTLSARCALLSGRNRYIFLKEHLHSALALVALPSPSIQLRIVAESLRRVVTLQSSKDISALEDTIDEAKRKNCKFLEVECRLLQMCLYCLHRRANTLKTAALNGASVLTPVKLSGNTSIQDTSSFKNEENNNNNNNDSGLEPCPLDVEASFNRIETLCRTYPHSVGKLSSVANEMKKAVYRSLQPHSIFTTEIMEVVNAWRPWLPSRDGALDEHDDGEKPIMIQRCSKHAHVYPVSTPASAPFAAPSDGQSSCPECGLDTSEGRQNTYEMHLREADFLTKMRELVLR